MNKRKEGTEIICSRCEKKFPWSKNNPGGGRCPECWRIINILKGRKRRLRKGCKVRPARQSDIKITSKAELVAEYEVPLVRYCLAGCGKKLSEKNEGDYCDSTCQNNHMLVINKPLPSPFMGREKPFFFRTRD